MKIAFIVDVFPSLSQTFILNQVTGLIDRGHTVHIFAANKDKGKPVHPDVEKYGLLAQTHYWNAPPAGIPARLGTFLAQVLRRPSKWALVARSLNAFRYGRRALFLNLFFDLLPFIQADEDFDVIHCQFGNLGDRGVFLRKIGATKARLITSFRGHDLSRRVQASGQHIYEGLFREGRWFLPVCDAFKNRLVEMGCPPAKIRVHRSGIELPKFPFTPRDFSFSGRNVRLLTVGRLEEKKGIYYAMQALAKLEKERPELSFTYEVAGDGPQAESLKEEMRRLGLERKVTFLGPRSQADVIGLLQSADIFLAPHVTSTYGDREGIPNVLKEAMATGLPVLSTFHSGIPELVAHGRTGFLVPEGDVAALAAQLVAVLQQGERLKGLTVAARKVIEQQYDRQLLNDELETIYSA